jgi:hypothetical protein
MLSGSNREVEVWQGQATPTKPRNSVFSLTIGCIVAIGIVSFAPVSLAAEDQELRGVQGYWRAQASWCSYRSPEKGRIEFASKNEDGKGSDTPPCNDGDSIMFNALLCLAGVKVEPGEEKAAPDGERVVSEVGCDVVRDSQTLTKGSFDYGRWWRSPRRAYLVDKI